MHWKPDLGTALLVLAALLVIALLLPSRCRHSDVRIDFHDAPASPIGEVRGSIAEGPE